MSVEFDRGSPGKLDSRTLNRKTLIRWTGRTSYGKFPRLARDYAGSKHVELPQSSLN